LVSNSPRCGEPGRGRVRKKRVNQRYRQSIHWKMRRRRAVRYIGGRQMWEHSVKRFGADFLELDFRNIRKGSERLDAKLCIFPADGVGGKDSPAKYPRSEYPVI
jgi:hypothetical protein